MMARHNYSAQLDGARAVARDIPVSPKHGREICRYLKSKNLQSAKRILENVIALRQPIPYLRHNYDLGHKPGLAAARYPVKASQWILKLLKSVEANAQFKGINAVNATISHIAVHVASRPWHAGRHRGRKMKRAHIEIIVQEQKSETPKQKKNARVEQTKAKQSTRGVDSKAGVLTK